MHECRFTKVCPFYCGQMMEGLDTVKKILKRNYCISGDVSCALYRIIVLRGKEFIPYDMLPDQTSRIEEIITQDIEPHGSCR